MVGVATYAEAKKKKTNRQISPSIHQLLFPSSQEKNTEGDTGFNTNGGVGTRGSRALFPSIPWSCPTCRSTERPTQCIYLEQLHSSCKEEAGELMGWFQ